MQRENLTNLECVALARLWRFGRCTAHQLRSAFAGSTAGRYSGSAGAIYPLMKRLEQSGYIRSAAARNGAQKKRLFSILKKGKRAVIAWMKSMPPPEIFPDDPLRTRVQYLDFLPRGEQERWRQDALNALDALDGAVLAEYESIPDRTALDDQVRDGVLDANRQRRRWVRSLNLQTENNPKRK